MDDDTRRLITAALVPIGIAGYVWFSNRLEARIRKMRPSIWRRILLLGRR